MAVRVQTDDFDLGAEAAALEAGAGAVVTFTGVVRGGDVTAMTLEHYPGMTEAALAEIEAEAHKRWALTDILIHPPRRTAGGRCPHHDGRRRFPPPRRSV